VAVFVTQVLGVGDGGDLWEKLIEIAARRSEMAQESTNDCRQTLDSSLRGRAAPRRDAKRLVQVPLKSNKYTKDKVR